MRIELKRGLVRIEVCVGEKVLRGRRATTRAHAEVNPSKGVGGTLRKFRIGVCRKT